MENAAFTAIDGPDDAGAGRGIDDFRELLVRKQHIPQLDLVTLSHFHGGLQANIIGAE